MPERKSLQTLIKAMFFLLAVGLLYALLSSLGGPSRVRHTATLFDDVLIGQTAARRDGTNRVWVTRLNAMQRTQANKLNNWVADPQSGCSLKVVLCVLVAETQRFGVDVVYTDTVPRGLKADTPWYGGFIDPSTGEVFDRMGRAYAETSTGRKQLEVSNATR